MEKGFTLVELSVVLVVIGLVVGGIMAGQSLIRVSEVRSITSDYQRFVSATGSFSDKYMGLPGDLKNATGYFGVDTTRCSTATPVGTGLGTCNGNGDGIILWDNSGAVSITKEPHQYWRQLVLAGMLEGKYTGYAGTTGSSADVVPGTNSPRSRVANAGWSVGGTNCGAGSGCYYGGIARYFRNYYVFGGRYGGNNPVTAVLSPAEALSVDSKIDDGKPATGKIMPYWVSANACTTSATNADTAGVYNTSNNGILCSLFFVRLF